MDEQVQKAFKTMLDKLTDEQKEQAKSCKTPDELMEFVGNAGVELPDELLCAVSGGSFKETIQHFVSHTCNNFLYGRNEWLYGVEEPPMHDPMDMAEPINDSVGGVPAWPTVEDVCG